MTGEKIVYVVYGTLAVVGALVALLGILTAKDRYEAARKRYR